jgi:hypothetical protein
LEALSEDGWQGQVFVLLVVNQGARYRV